MAEKSFLKVFAENTTDVENIDCAICLQSCVHPTVLPCGHIFCYLCVKGLGQTARMCAMCRQQFPVSILENPRLLRPLEESSESGFEDGYQWYYEGRNGWWQYDERTSQEIENAYKKGETSCEVSIAGRIYVIDLENMKQRQKFRELRVRQIKRDLVTIPKKGVSGIRVSVRASFNDEIEMRLAMLNLFGPSDE